VSPFQIGDRVRIVRYGTTETGKPVGLTGSVTHVGKMFVEVDCGADHNPPRCAGWTCHVSELAVAS
jgi:hypothetical protein